MHLNLPSSFNSTNHIRTLDLSHDLAKVADLIELCFPLHLDPDGQSYVKEMRKSARDMRLMGWLGNLAEMGNTKAAGFVWENDGQIIGNLSLIPFKFDSQYFHMIANVAVHPDHRGQGIAHELTQQALVYLRRINERRAWLQVRDDNPAAIHLYRSFGFKEQAVRTTWRIRLKDSGVCKNNPDIQLHIRNRKKSDWDPQKDWLAQNYPAELRWNLPVNFNRFSPGMIQTTVNTLDGVFLRHWAIDYQNEMQGVISWQKTNSYADNLWLATSAESEAKILPSALVWVLRRLAQRRPITIDYPAGRCDDQFEALGFSKFRTLIWMLCHLDQ